MSTSFTHGVIPVSKTGVAIMLAAATCAAFGMSIIQTRDRPAGSNAPIEQLSDFESGARWAREMQLRSLESCRNANAEFARGCLSYLVDAEPIDDTRFSAPVAVRTEPDPE